MLALINSSTSTDVVALCIWCLTRLVRNGDIAAGLIKQDVIPLLLTKGLTGPPATSRTASWCLGNLIWNDALADLLSTQNVIQDCANHLMRVTDTSDMLPEDICAAIFVVGRMARSIKLSKLLAKAGCVDPLVRQLNTSDDPLILQWSARAVGCLMRPNSADMSKTLLEAGAAKGLARLPQVIPTEAIEPLESFAFAIQRFSCAEWGSTTRKALVDAGVVDSLLAALRTAADVPWPQAHIELALAVSFLGDVGGASIRKEIVRAGGIDILKRVGANGKPDVAKACNTAVTSITGNILTRNAGEFPAKRYYMACLLMEIDQRLQKPPCRIIGVEVVQNISLRAHHYQEHCSDRSRLYLERRTFDMPIFFSVYGCMWRMNHIFF